MGIALLPMAAGSSLPLEATRGKTVLPKGVLMVVRAAKWLLEAAEDCIFKKRVGGGFGLVWFLKKNALDYYAHREFSTPFIDIE